MKISGISPKYFLFIGLFFILILNGVFFYYYNYKKDEPVKTESSELIDNNIRIVDEVALKSSSTVLNKISSDDYILGNANAKVEMIVYDDPSEYFAPQYYETIKKVLAEFGDKIKIAYRMLPLELNANSDYYSIAVMCAGEQGKYYEMYEELVTANKNKKLRMPYPFGATSVYSLDLDKFKTCQESEVISNKLELRKEEALENNIIGVPSTFINGFPFPGAYQLEDFVDSAGYKREGLRSIIQKQLTVDI